MAPRWWRSASATAERLGDAVLRKAAATFARAASKHTTLAPMLDRRRPRRRTARRPGGRRRDRARLVPVLGVQARQDAVRGRARSCWWPRTGGTAARGRAPTQGAAIAGAVTFARDLANTPPGRPDGPRTWPSRPSRSRPRRARRRGLRRGPARRPSAAAACSASTRARCEPPRLVKLTYTPRNGRAAPRPRRQGRDVRLRRPSLKTNDGMTHDEDGHVGRRRGAGGDDGARRAEGRKSKVTGYLMCTDNMPSGSA